MLTYNDEKTEVKAGDICECISPVNWTKAFRLIRRKDQPMPDPQPEPLVKWPEGELEYGQLEEGDLFVPMSHKQIPCVKTSDSFMVINGATTLPCIILTERCKVRRIRFNPANKEAVYVVI